MKPLEFPEQTTTYTAQGCDPLPAAQHEGTINTKWRGTWRDRLRFLRTGVVWLWVYAEAHPPVAVETEDPYR